jgi:hypothetical protein
MSFPLHTPAVRAQLAAAPVPALLLTPRARRGGRKIRPDDHYDDLADELADTAGVTRRATPVALAG